MTPATPPPIRHARIGAFLAPLVGTPAAAEQLRGDLSSHVAWEMAKRRDPYRALIDKLGIVTTATVARQSQEDAIRETDPNRKTNEWSRIEDNAPVALFTTVLGLRGLGERTRQEVEARQLPAQKRSTVADSVAGFLGHMHRLAFVNGATSRLAFNALLLGMDPRDPRLTDPSFVDVEMGAELVGIRPEESFNAAVSTYGQVSTSLRFTQLPSSTGRICPAAGAYVQGADNKPTPAIPTLEDVIGDTVIDIVYPDIFHMDFEPER